MSTETALRDRMACPHCRAIFRGSFARCPRDGTELDVAIDDPLVGSTLAERYIVETLLGEGAMGRVYRARHTRMSRRFAIKVLFGDCALDSKTQARFSQEAEAASRLSHRHVVGVVDFGETAEGLLYLAMDYADGPTLATVIAREGPMAPERVLALSTQLAEGLAHAHGRGLVHRDFKPDNIIVGVDDDQVEVCRIVDFGIAVLRDDDDALIQGRLTTAGLVMGTPHYMAPEQATGDLVDERTDLFALGLTIYEMLAGVLPFDGAPVQVARMNLAVDPPPISERVRGLVADPLLESLAFWLMAKRPDERPQTSRQVVELLELIGRDRTAAAATLGRRDDGPIVVAGSPTPVPRGATMPMAAAGANRRPSRPSSVTDVVDVAAMHPDLGTELGTGQDTDVDAAASSTRARRRKAAVIVAAALGLAGLGGTLAIVLSGRGATPTPARVAPVEVAPTPTPTPVPTVEPVPTPTPEVIAEVAKPTPTVEPVPTPTPTAEVIAEVAKPTPTPRKPKPTSPSKPAKPTPTPAPVEVKPTPPVTRPEPAADVPTVGNLTAQYRAAGQAIEALLRDKGSAVANPLKNRYLKIPYADALRNPALREDVLARLAQLRRDVAAAR